MRYGLRSVYYATPTATGGYNAPVRLPGGVAVTLNAMTNTITRKSVTGNASPATITLYGYDGRLEITSLPISFFADVMQVAGGVDYIRDITISAGTALLFEITGDTAERHVYYNTIFTPAGVTSKTKTKSVSINNEIIPIICRSSERGIRRILRPGDSGYNDFFNEVQ